KVSDLFPVTHLNSPSIFESQSGLVGSVIKVDGAAFEIEEADTLNHQRFLMHGFTVKYYTVKIKDYCIYHVLPQ
ncbi:hypothetical protein MXD98_16585, partial [Legionella pneumophila]|uniref:hypothetical protein n=1 Tax=Legionella pneumophila TaxID=446 RepID=UPI001FF76931